MYFDVSPEAAKPAGPRGARITRKTRNTTIAYRPARSVIKYYCNVQERQSVAMATKTCRQLDVGSSMSAAPGRHQAIRSALTHAWSPAPSPRISSAVDGYAAMADLHWLTTRREVYLAFTGLHWRPWDAS
jgi:hypothetical protein